jgi:streptomycin 6-kinase
MQIPERLRATIERVHGEAGRHWLAAVPALISECQSRWSLELYEPFENLSYNLVIPGRMPDNTEIVLKVGVPCRELLTEAAALSLFDGAGAVRLLDHNAPLGMLLMERVSPGWPLHNLQNDAEATRIAAKLMLRLWRTPPAGQPFPSLKIWFRAFEQLRDRFDGGSGPFPPELIASAERAFAGLNALPSDNVILHGDLHHSNILYSARSGWEAIDPKGICGDRGYEIGSFMLNQLPSGATDVVVREILRQRLSIFSTALQIGLERLAGWAFCHAVLSALWDFEETSDWSGTLQLAQMLEQLSREKLTSH